MLIRTNFHYSIIVGYVILVKNDKIELPVFIHACKPVILGQSY